MGSSPIISTGRCCRKAWSGSGDTSQRVQVPIFQQAGPTTVPDVVGVARVPAGNTIRAAELVPRFSGASGNATEVERQTPAAGTSVARGTTVQLHMVRLV